LIRPELALGVEIAGEPVAFALTILDINPVFKRINGRLFPFGLLRLLWALKIRRSLTTGRVTLVGIKEAYRRRGIDALLLMETYRGAREVGLTGGEIGWTLEDNDLANRLIAAAGGRKTKTYRVYGMDL
jgi:hypothetical protein